MELQSVTVMTDRRGGLCFLLYDTVQTLHFVDFIKQYFPFFSLGTGLVALLSRKNRETPLDSGLCMNSNYCIITPTRPAIKNYHRYLPCGILYHISRGGKYALYQKNHRRPGMGRRERPATRDV